MPHSKNTVVTTVTQNNKCPGCGTKVNAATGTDGVSVPVAGDLSVCFKCGTLLVFNKDLSVSLLDLEQLVSLDQDVRDELEKIQIYVTSFKKNHH